MTAKEQAELVKSLAEVRAEARAAALEEAAEVADDFGLCACARAIRALKEAR